MCLKIGNDWALGLPGLFLLKQVTPAFVSAMLDRKYMCQGLNSHYFHIIGDGHQPNTGSGLSRASLHDFDIFAC